MRPTRAELRLGLAVLGTVVVAAIAAELAFPMAAAGIAVGTAAAILAVFARRASDDQRRRTDAQDREWRAALRMTHAEIEETRALVAIQEPRFSLPLPWTGWSLPPRGLLEVLKTVQQFDAPVIVDCGSGVSTLHLARAVREIGRGRVIALEQDAAWAEYIRRMLERNQLDKWATIVVAPVEKTQIDGQDTMWYALPADAVPADMRVDVVVADGPTGQDGVLARLGALPRLWDRLSDNAAVFLDDTTRSEEQEICRIWRERYPVTETSVGSEHGMSKFTRRPR